jgi:hypothetical protein
MNTPDPSQQTRGARETNDSLGDLSAPARELAQRRSGTDEILLLWHPDGNRVELLVHNPHTCSGFLIEIAAGDAMDAFYHPYVYAARDESPPCVVEYRPAAVDA